MKKRNRLNRIYSKMRERCYNERHNRYKYYGAKGIIVEWGTFREFKVDMGESYVKHVKRFGEKDTQIDRIDPAGNYCKENCRWVTHKEQQNNRSDTRKILFKGKIYTTGEIAEIINKPTKYVYSYLFERRLSIEDLLET